MPLTMRMTKAAMATAIASALVISGGAAWAAWRFAGEGRTTAAAGSVITLQATATTYPQEPLYPGARAGIRVTIRNENSFPILVNLVKSGTGSIVVDEPHRLAGCVQTGVSLVSTSFGVTWGVAARSQASHVLPNAVKMTNASNSGCQGATFGIPLALSGRSDAH
ncbi:hypothetical protein [Actinoplanes sp. HUAS TT8]|uniref:hypothetical protein n=1 Tax=Actinoplanes sp. HUAS TT8 TaxID=3447453 RepID=UPI003F51FD22